jgi:hypothetical protein
LCLWGALSPDEIVTPGSFVDYLVQALQEWVTFYALPMETVRLDTTSVSVYTTIEDEWGLIQRGHSKDHRPDLGQFKVMLSTLDPLEMPLSCAGLEGQRADDPLYVPIYDQTVWRLGRRNVLVVGDSKMAALATRGHMVAGGSASLCSYCPLGQSTDLTDWIEQARPETLGGLNPAVRSQATTRPTTERVLQVFNTMTLTLVKLEATLIRHVTELSDTQRHGLALLNLPSDLYSRLADNWCKPLLCLRESEA